jgi:hypothetical protein
VVLYEIATDTVPLTDKTAVMVLCWNPAPAARQLAFARTSTAERSQSRPHRILPIGPSITSLFYHGFC